MVIQIMIQKTQQDLLAWRILAFLIDGYIIIGITIVSILIIRLKFFLSLGETETTLIIFLIQSILLTFKDVFGIGKRIMHLEVIDERTGTKASWYKRVYRNIPLVFLHPIELILAICSRRIGDKMAKTSVEKKQDQRSKIQRNK